MNKSNVEQKPKVESLSRGEQNYGTRGQSVKVKIWRILGRKWILKKRELKQYLHDIEQEREQVAAFNPSCTMEPGGEVRRLARIIDEM